MFVFTLIYKQKAVVTSYKSAVSLVCLLIKSLLRKERKTGVQLHKQIQLQQYTSFFLHVTAHTLSGDDYDIQHDQR